MGARVAGHLNSDVRQMACLSDTPVQCDHIFVFVDIGGVNDDVLDPNKEIRCSSGTISCKVEAIDQRTAAESRGSFEDWTIIGIANQYRIQTEVNRPRDRVRAARNKNFGRSRGYLVSKTTGSFSVGVDGVL